MHIQRASFQNLKGRSGSYDMAPATLICGPNFSGKTAIAEAIRLTLLGHLPEIGKTNGATFALSSGAKMGVSVMLDSGLRLSREFWEERGSIKSKDDLGIIALDMKTPLMDPSEYFDASPAARIDYVFSKVTLPESFSPDGINATLKRVSLGEEHTEAHEKAQADLIMICQEVFEESDSVADALKKLTDETLKDEFSAASLRAKNTMGAVRHLTELKLREGECSAETLTDLRNQRSRLDGLLADAHAEAARLREQQQNAARAQRRREELERALREPEPDFRIPPQQPWIDPRPELEKQLAALDAEIAGFAPLAEGTAHNEAAANLKLEEARFKQGQINEELQKANKAKHEVMSLGCCPYCQGKAKGWQKKLIEVQDKEILRLQLLLKPAELEELRGIAEVAHQAHLNYVKAVKNQNEARADKHLIEARIKDATETATRREREAAAAVADARTLKSAHEARMKAMREELGAMQEAPVLPQHEIDAALSNVEYLKHQISDNVNRHEAGLRLQQDLVRAAQASADHDEAAARVTIVKEFGKRLKEIKGELVGAAFGELLKVANSICADILPAPLAYHEGDIGYFSKSGFVKHSAFSGTERALAYAAISAALSAGAQFKLLILDELGRLTSENQAKACQCFADAVETGLLDQVIAILPLDAEDAAAFEAPPGWKLIVTDAEVMA